MTETSPAMSRENLSEPSYSHGVQTDEEALENTDTEDYSYTIEGKWHRLKEVLYLPFDKIWETTLVLIGIACIFSVVYDFANHLKSNTRTSTVNCKFCFN